MILGNTLPVSLYYRLGKDRPHRRVSDDARTRCAATFWKTGRKTQEESFICRGETTAVYLLYYPNNSWA